MAASSLSVVLRNGYKMPILGLGTFTASKEEVKVSVNSALETGYRHIDTAYSYGNEDAIGEVLKEWLDSGRVRREELFITTKLPLFGNRAEGVDKYIKKSLESLKLSYVDLYLIHHAVGFHDQTGTSYSSMTVDPSTDHLSIWKAMEAQVDAGRARSIGLSNFNARQVKRIVKAARIPPANLQVELHVYGQQRELTAFCKALDVTMCAYSPLGAPGFPAHAKRIGRDVSNYVLYTPLKDPVVLEVAKKHGKTPAQVLLRHIIQRGIVAIPKSNTPARIKENFQALNFQLDDADMAQLDGIDKGRKGRMFGKGFAEGMTSHPEFAFNDPY